MADSPTDYILMTNAGVSLASQLLGNTNHIVSFRAVASDTNYYNESSDMIAELETVTPEKQIGVIVGEQTTGKNTSQIQIDFKSADVDNDYSLYTIAVYATDSNGVEVLYSVYCLKNPDYMAQSTDGDVSSYFLNLIVGNAANVTVQVSQAGSVSRIQLNEILKDYVLTSDLDKLIAEKIPDTLADITKDEHVTGVWNFDHLQIGGKELTIGGKSGSVVMTGDDVTISGQYNFTKVPTINGVPVANTDAVQQLVDQIADLKGQIDAQTKWVPIAQADYDTAKENGTLDPKTAYLIY